MTNRLTTSRSTLNFGQLSQRILSDINVGTKKKMKAKKDPLELEFDYMRDKFMANVQKALDQNIEMLMSFIKKKQPMLESTIKLDQLVEES